MSQYVEINALQYSFTCQTFTTTTSPTTRPVQSLDLLYMRPTPILPLFSVRPSCCQNQLSTRELTRYAVSLWHQTSCIIRRCVLVVWMSLRYLLTSCISQWFELHHVRHVVLRNFKVRPPPSHKTYTHAYKWKHGHEYCICGTSSARVHLQSGTVHP